MDFDLNDEQRQLKDSVERLLAASYGDLNKRMGYMKEPKGYSAALWKQYADLGLLAVPFAEEHGGLGQGLTETMIIAEAFGRALVIAPYFATVVLSGGVLRLGQLSMLGIAASRRTSIRTSSSSSIRTPPTSPFARTRCRRWASMAAASAWPSSTAASMRRIRISRSA